jgi:hypothetical protein
MSFDPLQSPSENSRVHGTPTPKVRVHLGVCEFIPSQSPTLPVAWNVTPRLHFWLTPLQAFALVTSLRLRLQQKIMEGIHLTNL